MTSDAPEHDDASDDRDGGGNGRDGGADDRDGGGNGGDDRDGSGNGGGNGGDDRDGSGNGGGNGGDDRDDWERVGATLDWVAALVAARLDTEPIDLVRPGVVVGLVCGLAAEGLNAATGASPALVLVGVTLTVTGYGMFVLLAERFRRGSGSGGGTRSGEAAMLAPWLRKLQVLMLGALVVVLALLLYGAVSGSWLLLARNTLEIGRVGMVVLICSWLLLDDEVGMPEWLASRGHGPAPTTSH